MVAQVGLKQELRFSHVEEPKVPSTKKHQEVPRSTKKYQEVPRSTKKRLKWLQEVGLSHGEMLRHKHKLLALTDCRRGTAILGLYSSMTKN